MNILTHTGSNTNQVTMSSREIAQLCQKQHGHVCRDIENLNTIYEQMGLSKIGEGYYTHENTGSQQHREFLLNKEQSTDLITGYKPELRIKINRRWAELESRELSKMEILQMALESEQQKLQLQAQIELQAPKVEYYDKVVERSTLLNASQVAQKLKMSAVKMNKLLDAFNVYHHGVKRARLFQQWFIDKGLGEVKQTELGFSQPMFTTKGEAWVIEKLVSEGVA